MGKRLLSLLLIFVLVAVSVPVQAAYENTHTNTGNQRADIIAVAMTQVGYREGDNNDTKYGDWYGLSNHPWCGMFVSWCANQAGVSTSVIKKAAIASPSSFGFSTYFTSDQKGPQSGDLFFKKNFNHVGLVTGVEGDYFYTVEGNTNNAGTDGVGVFTLKRKLSDYYFVSPAYPTDAGHNYLRGYEGEHPHKEYYSCSHCGGFYYTGVNGTSQSCTTCIQAACSHRYGSWAPSGSGHNRVCSLCAREESGNHSWNSGKVLTEPICGKAGALSHSCTVCGYEETVTIAPTEEHRWGAWTGKANGHSRICEKCKEEEFAEHTGSGFWETTETAHLYHCTTCQAYVEEPHSYPQGCETACGDCGFLPENGHDVGWQTDENTHWGICTRCDREIQQGAHIFESDCDDLCDICGYTRQVTHVYGEELAADHFGHWQVCTLCGGTSPLEAHVPGPEATETQAQHCVTCGHEINPMLEHIHSYASPEYDAASHWGTCACGYSMEAQIHAWTPDGFCSVCGAPAVVPGGVDLGELLWLLIPALVLLSAMVLVIAIGSGKKKAERV